MKRAKTLHKKSTEKKSEFQQIKPETQNSDEYSAELAKYSFCLSFQPISLKINSFFERV